MLNIETHMEWNWLTFIISRIIITQKWYNGNGCEYMNKANISISYGDRITSILKSRVSLAWLFSLFFAFMHFIGKMFYEGIKRDSLRVFPTLLSMSALWVMYYVLIKLMYCALDYSDLKRPKAKRLYERFSERPFEHSLIIMFVMWLPHLLIKYPSGVCGDSAGQIFQNFFSYTTHQPILHTLFMGVFVKLGIKLGSANMGLFISTFLQTVVEAIIFSYSIRVAVRKGAKDWSVWMLLAFFCLSPFVTGYVGQSIKDVCYVMFLYLFTVCITKWARENSYWKSANNVIILFISSFGTIMFRNNGKYVLVPTLLVCAIIEIANCRKKHIKSIWLRLSILISCCVFPIVATNCLTIAVNAEKGSIVEALSVPLQQTARFVRDYPEEVADEERAAISTVLDYDKLAEEYTPSISDPVKGQFKLDAKVSELPAFLKAWSSLFFKHPMCYIDAVLEQSYYLFFPEYNNYAYYLGTESCTSYVELIKAYEIYIGTPELLKKLLQPYEAMLSFLHTAPVLSLINNMAVFDIVFVMMCAFFLTKKRYKELVALLPVVLSLAVVVLGPCIRNHVRYAFPIIYTLPFVITVYTIPEEMTCDEVRL